MHILLTGGSGFIGKHCLSYLLKHGHTVVATVRSSDKGEQLLSSNPDAKTSNQLRYSIVEDIATPGSFDNVVQSSPPFDAVLHTASPFHYNVIDPKKDMIDPAVQGTTEILRAIQKHAPSIKRVVVTSSFVAMINFPNHPAVYTPDIWNPITMEMALTGGMLTYIGSKKFAEKAAWDFIQQENPHFSLSTVNPVLVFGPVSDLTSLAGINTSNAIFRDIITGKYRDAIPPGGFRWVDVRDVALAHVRALEVPEAAGKRLIADAGTFTHARIAQIVKDSFPELADRLPAEIELPAEEAGFGIDTRLVNEVLGVPFRSLEESVVDTVRSLLGVEH
ncbi:dihydroflavonol-4-reductase [Aspergillus californicus]